VPRSPETEAARRQWASSAQEYLLALSQAVDGLRELFQADREATSEADEVAASQVVSACSNLNDWLRSGHAPRGLAKAGGELGAAAGVYRNAAVAFKSLDDVDGDQREARANACATLLEQGDHHVETFVAALAKKLGDAVR
jgi:enoyl reductase-like protein